MRGRRRVFCALPLRGFPPNSPAGPPSAESPGSGALPLSIGGGEDRLFKPDRYAGRCVPQPASASGGFPGNPVLERAENPAAPPTREMTQGIYFLSVVVFRSVVLDVAEDGGFGAFNEGVEHLLFTGGQGEFSRFRVNRHEHDAFRRRKIPYRLVL